MTPEPDQPGDAAQTTPESIVQEAAAYAPPQTVIRCDPPDGRLREFVDTGVEIDDHWAVMLSTTGTARLCTESEVQRHVERSMPAVYLISYEKSMWGDGGE